jgi:hypothetical protein
MVSTSSPLLHFLAQQSLTLLEIVGAVLSANPDAHLFAKKFYKFLSKPLPSGRAQLEPNPVRLMPGGFEKVIPDGFALLGSGSVSQREKLARDEGYMRPISGEKLVYIIN